MRIRKFAEEDAERVLELMIEMIEFYGAPPPRIETTRAELILHSQHLDILVAAEGSSVHAFSVSGLMYPVTDLVPFTYVQQIYVAKSKRRMGIAVCLMREIAIKSLSRGLSRVEWSTTINNLPARSLYESIGAKAQDKVHFVLHGQSLADFASSSGSGTDD